MFFFVSELTNQEILKGHTKAEMESGIPLMGSSVSITWSRLSPFRPFVSSDTNLDACYRAGIRAYILSFGVRKAELCVALVSGFVDVFRLT